MIAQDRQPRPGQILIRFWSRLKSPKPALVGSADPGQAGPLAGDWQVATDGAWRKPRPGATFDTVRNYMLDWDLDIVDTALVEQRRNGHWEGRFIVELGRPAHTEDSN
jgi:hypothetical protein